MGSCSSTSAPQVQQRETEVQALKVERVEEVANSNNNANDREEPAMVNYFESQIATLKSLREVFSEFDPDGNGTLEHMGIVKNALDKAVEEGIIEKKMMGRSMGAINKGERNQLLEESGVISFRDFACGVLGVEPLQLAMVAFDYADTDDSGNIDLAEAKTVMQLLGIKPAEADDYQTKFEECDLNGDGKLQVNEFMKLLFDHEVIPLKTRLQELHKVMCAAEGKFGKDKFSEAEILKVVPEDKHDEWKAIFKGTTRGFKETPESETGTGEVALSAVDTSLYLADIDYITWDAVSAEMSVSLGVNIFSMFEQCILMDEGIYDEGDGEYKKAMENIENNRPIKQRLETKILGELVVGWLKSKGMKEYKDIEGLAYKQVNWKDLVKQFIC